MTAAVAPAPQVHEPYDSSALARKRRREILLSQRACVPDLASSLSPEPEEALPQKRRRISHEVSEESDSSDSKPRKRVASKKGKASAKKPQMKYDPDVPMTKEEAAVWRREQRRKRNRESAAASRQRQRDRIVELEIELADWKSKFGGVMEKLHKMEEVTKTSITADLMTDIMASAPPQSVVSPTSSPKLTPCQSPTASPVASCSFVDAGTATADCDQVHHVEEEESEEQLLNKMISRPAKS